MLHSRLEIHCNLLPILRVGSGEDRNTIWWTMKSKRHDCSRRNIGIKFGILQKFLNLVMLFKNRSSTPLGTLNQFGREDKAVQRSGIDQFVLYEQHSLYGSFPHEIISHVLHKFLKKAF